jgi:glycosyltransferase involved in cell wall biosynthesis
VISDNGAIAEYVEQVYGVDSHVIAYGGDHALADDASPVDEYNLPDNYAFSVCRIEPENNVHWVVEAFAQLPTHILVMVGNWNNSEYGRGIRERYASCANLYLLDSIYDLGKLNTLRSRAALYVHGHSAGGTNPSLVEAMHFGRPVLAFDCSFNRSTTEDQALFFSSAEELMRLVETMDATAFERAGREMLAIANRRYTWNIVAQQYFELLGA